MSKFIILLPVLLLLSACSDAPVELIVHDFDFSGKEGVFVVNEGNYMFGNSSLTFLSTHEELVYNDIFILANSVPLGDVAESMTISGDTGFIVVNNSGRIYRIDLNTAEITGEISGLVSPRNLLMLDAEKAYVSDLYEKAITIVDPSDCSIKGKISLDNGESGYNHHTAEQMLETAGKVFVNSWNYDAMIMVIDPATDRVIDSLSVLTQPNSMVLDRNGDLWVLCDGGYPGNPYNYEAPGLLRIDPELPAVTRVYRFEEGTHPFSLTVNPAKDSLYFINKDVWKMSVDAASLPDEPFIRSRYNNYFQGGFYALGIDPEGEMIYVSDAIDHLQRGVVFRYRPDGVVVDSFRAGISPGDFVFWGSTRKATGD